MQRFSNYDKVKPLGDYMALPKGAYVLRILDAREKKTKDGKGSYIQIGFDISEGEYIGFYQTDYDNQTGNDRKWNNDGIYRLNVPTDNSKEFIQRNFRTFTEALEDSNHGYRFDWDESKWRGLQIGGLFHIEQSEYNGKVYNHTRLARVCSVEKIHSGKYKLPDDDLISARNDNGGSGGWSDAQADGFMNVQDGGDALPFD